jgi:hypothetical protein
MEFGDERNAVIRRTMGGKGLLPGAVGIGVELLRSRVKGGYGDPRKTGRCAAGDFVAAPTGIGRKSRRHFGSWRRK